MLTRAELLGQLMTNYDIPIAVSGTHGKTTTLNALINELNEKENKKILTLEKPVEFARNLKRHFN